MMHFCVEVVALTLAIASSVSAQTSSLCNPTKGQVCPPNPAFGGPADFDFGKASKLDDLNAFWNVDDGIKYDDKQVKFDGSKASLIIYDEADAPTLISKQYLFFGKVEVTLQAAPGRGIVTSVVLQSDSLDEIDWEFIGSDTNHVQTNYYSKGVNDYTHAKYFEVSYDVTKELHTYTFEWTPEALIFSIDGKVLRTATPAEGSYPQTPMQLRLGTWVGGKGVNQGTIDWAGGLAEWGKAPFTGYYKNIKVTDYGGGTTGAKEYVYEGTSGTWQSIKVVGGKEGSLPSLSLPAETSTTVTGKTGPSSTSSILTSTTGTDSSSVSLSTTSTSGPRTTGSRTTTSPASTSTTGVPGSGASKISGAFLTMATVALLASFL